MTDTAARDPLWSALYEASRPWSLPATGVDALVAAVLPSVEQAQDFAARLEALNAAGLAEHPHDGGPHWAGWCDGCGFSWPCPTVRALNPVAAELAKAPAGEGEAAS